MSPRRSKYGTILAGLVIGILLLAGTTQTWFMLELRDGTPLGVLGSTAAPAQLALSLASLAGCAALAIAGLFFRAVLGALVGVIGVLVGLTAITAELDPIAASGGAVGEATGLTGANAVAAEVLSVAATPWPLLSAALGLALFTLGILIVLARHRWPEPARKYQAVGFAGDAEPGDVDTWDALSEGSDPTERPNAGR